MNTAFIRKFNRTILLAGAPFLGLLLYLALSASSINIVLSEDTYNRGPSPAPVNLQQLAAPSRVQFEQAGTLAAHTGTTLERQLKLYTQTTADVSSLAKLAAAQTERPLIIYDNRIMEKLGKPVATINSDKLRAQLFYLDTMNFASYGLKIKLKQDDAAELVLGEDKFGGSETTLEAVRRKKAAVGVNAGGFADNKSGRYPIGTTIIDGNYAGGFQPSVKDLFFVGLNVHNELIGGVFEDKASLDALQPRFGASFVPVLMENGRRTEIPAKWQTSPKRAPRTVIGNFKDNQLLFIVADGYDEKGSSGATLAEMQILLQRYGAVNGYNLDGGGSSALVFNGNVINNPSDGKLRRLPTNFVFYK